MSRTLNPSLELAMLGERRRPGFVVEIWDIRSTSGEATPSRINDVVEYNLGLSVDLPDIVGPRDFTGDVRQIQITETAGDYVESGVTSTSIQMVIADPTGALDPVTNAPTVAAPEASGRWLRQGNVVVIREGDYAEPDTSFWPITFTGRLQGSPGQDRNRTSGVSELTCKANSREVDFLRRINTTANYPQSVAFSTIVDDIARTDMGLSPDEIAVGSVGAGRATAFLSTQFVQESPLTSIAKLLFPDGFMPRFLGNGQLGVSNGIITKSPARVYDDAGLIRSITRPPLELNGLNDITIKGLDPDLDQIVQARQELARASITTGFFSDDAKIRVRWSEDGTQQALGARMDVLSSIADAPFAFGSESFSAFALSDGGSVEGEIDVDGSLSKGLGILATLAGLYIAASFIPDYSIPISGGPTIRVGTRIQGLLSQAIMLVLGQAARGEYRITGQPYEYVFPEIVATFRVSGLRSEDRNSKVIENHLINSQADADAIAERVLRRVRARQNVRSIEMIHDLKLEPDDVFEVLDRRYMITSISRTLVRGAAPILAQISGFEVTTGVRP